MAERDPQVSQRRLIDSFAARLERESGPVQVFETHISFVLVAGGYAYKFKKAVKLPFLDFSALEKRRFYCNEEVRLNRRLAPQLYLGVVALAGSRADPVPDGMGPVLEYAVKMRAFSQESLWSRRMELGLLTALEVDRLAAKLSLFHSQAAKATKQTVWGRAETVARIAADNFSELRKLAGDRGARDDVARLEAALAGLERDLHATFDHRKNAGRIRECHGDLHCANVLTLDGKATIFDCIEFDEALRWIDVVNDLAFLCMDLGFHGYPRLAARLLNGWLEDTGDYQGLAVFRYYRAQRAVVRCKIAWLRAAQFSAQPPAGQACDREARAYLSYAASSLNDDRPALLVTHGFSGCGKSTLAGYLVEVLGAIRIRSDVERKRLHGMAATDRTGGDELYANPATQQVYTHLLNLARQVLMAGWPVVIDAAFLRSRQREPFRLLAATLGVPYVIFDIRAGIDTLTRRLAMRRAENRDASDAGTAVLASQIAHAEPLSASEMADSIKVDAEAGFDAAMVERLCAPILRRSGGEAESWR